MLQPLIVSQNESFLNQIQSESNRQVLATNSYIQGLRWISDPSIPISGIYLNPNDTSYSAIKFLAIALLQRPATPTFILDEEGTMTNQNFYSLAEKFKIRRAFRGTPHFAELLDALQTKIPEGLKAVQTRGIVTSRYFGYLAVPVIDFIHSKRYPFNVFMEDEFGELRFFAMEDSEVDLEYLTFLSKKTSCLYVEESSIVSRKEAIQFVEEAYLDPGYLSPSWRSAETLYRTKLFLEDLRNNGMSEEIVTHAYGAIEKLFLLVGQLSKDAYLRRFVDQARQCDRTVACATLATLMCRKLRFETSVVTESLGLASFFQDISLYNSPFGDLSQTHPLDMSDTARQYYYNHPIASAVLVSSVENIPEVTRQIIRQHHERADRTGFPNKVGGTQLQPLAEILSLINAYFDCRELDRLEIDVFSHYSETIVSAFREILTALGRYPVQSTPILG